ncbi:MAG: hypothetical protein H5T50_07725 [Nitrososphaeria archaeon]|nr:hypothetical protein [Nitrososphaeria archaeon]
MQRRTIFYLISFALFLLLSSVIIYSILPLENRHSAETVLNETAYIDLRLNGKLSAPSVVYIMENGTEFVVEKKNPFPFEIELNLPSQPDFPKQLYVYKIYVNKSENCARVLASKYGFNNLYYNKDVNVFLANNLTHSFEFYTVTGYFRIMRINMSPVKEEFTNKNIPIDVVLEILRDKGLLKVNEYTVKVGDYEVIDNRPVLKSIVLKPKIDGYEIDAGIIVVLDSKLNIVSIEGTVLDKIEGIKKYEVKSVEEVVDELKTKVANGEPMIDWEIDWIAFTKLSINSIKLKYYWTKEDYFIPVYEIRCTYVLEFDGIRDYGGWGEVTANIIAIKK